MNNTKGQTQLDVKNKTKAMQKKENKRVYK